MLTVTTAVKFRRDLRICAKRHYNMALLSAAINTLRIPAPLPRQNKDHGLTGQYAGHRECHIQPDWLLIYRVDGDELYLARTGTHAELFGE